MLEQNPSPKDRSFKAARMVNTMGQTRKAIEFKTKSNHIFIASNG